MQKIAFKIGAGIAAGALLVSSMATAVFADNTVDISGNGENSSNTVTINNVCTASVTQKNKTYVNVNATVIASTGGNEASGNTGGNVDITTGTATSAVDVTVGGSSNSADAPGCCGCISGVDVTISENGVGSNNDSTTNNVNTTSVKQKNKTKVKVKAKVKSKTGKNKANGNTGGDVGINSGNADATTSVTVDPSSNSL